MNARMYDPITRRVISPDNYIQAPDNTQSFNRYSYCFNSPLKYTDPSGDIVVESIIMAAMIGGMINATSQSMSGNINSTMDFMKAFGIGALAGAGGAFVGGAVAASVGVGGFVGGAAAGAAGGATGGFIGGAGNSWIQGGSFKDGIYSGLIGAGIGAAGGAIVGGAVGGIKSSINGKTFWDGRYTKTYLKENGITLTGKSISESELDDFINSNFKNRIEMMKYKPDISVNDKMVSKLASSKISAVTVPMNGKYDHAGASNIYLRNSCLISDKKLFYVLDHELIHASHYSDGSFAYWRSLFGDKRAITISEIYAYKSGIPVSHNLGLPYTEWSKSQMLFYYHEFLRLK